MLYSEVLRKHYDDKSVKLDSAKLPIVKYIDFPYYYQDMKAVYVDVPNKSHHFIK